MNPCLESKVKRLLLFSHNQQIGIRGHPIQGQSLSTGRIQDISSFQNNYAVARLLIVLATLMRWSAIRSESEESSR